MLTNQSTFAIGIDIGGTTTKFGVVNKDGKILQQNNIASNKHSDIHFFIEELYQNIQPLIENFGGNKNCVGIGIGAPNGNFYSGTIEFAPNLIWKGIIPLASLIQNKFGLKTLLTNDANAAAVGEMMYGVAKGLKHFITITLGTGVGSGIVIDGKILLGYDGFAGELGHTIIRHNGRLHKGTGALGSLESYVSASGIVATAQEFLSNDILKESLLHQYSKDELTSQIIYSSAMKGDKVAQKVFEFSGEILGEALANFVMFSSPEMIVLFGGITNAGDLLMHPTKTAMEKNLLPIFRNKVKLVFSILPASDAAILGASALVWEN
jgi:glucokinase